MSGFEGIEKAGVRMATEAQIEFIYQLLDWLGDSRFVDQEMTREEASEVIDCLKFELETRRRRR